VEAHQAAGRWVVLQQLGPAVIGKEALDKVLAEGQVVEAALFLHWQQRKALYHLAGKYAGAGALGHAVFVVDFDTKQARRRRPLFIRVGAIDKTLSR